MTWEALVAIFIVAALLFFRRKSSANNTSQLDFSEQQAKTEKMPREEQLALADDIRALAFAGYDRLSSGALEDGRDESFANEVGVLDAAMCVLANENSQRQNSDIRAAVQMEALPFNAVDPFLGRAGIAEYLVWKFFPHAADMNVLEQAIARFVDTVFDKADKDAGGSDHIFKLIYSDRYDWQKLAVAEVKKRKDDA